MVSVSPVPLRRLLVAAILSGGLLFASFYPLKWSFLAWVALVPLLALVRVEARPRNIGIAAFLGGLVFFLPVMQWIRVAHPMMYLSSTASSGSTWIPADSHRSAHLGFLRLLPDPFPDRIFVAGSHRIAAFHRIRLVSSGLLAG
jgi:Apolipoprotein N-acyltransferase N-terminal domain